ncbi:MAG: glycosyltransferase family 2 protein [Lachnospiraceae bacterium]|nr:glycosyltransferase family 2 protein [Lachnospiraceae bacterium]
MKKKILTIVVPMYNVGCYIKQCLDSFVVPEVMDKVEILAIDDGGTDQSAKIAQGFGARYPGTFRVIQKENGGHGSVINRGIEEASGRYFRVVDGDDWVDREGFIHLVGHLEETDADMVLSNYHWVDHRSGRRSTEVDEICPGIGYGATYPFEEVGEHIFMKMHAITYKTEVIREQPERLDEHCFYVDTEYMLFPLPYVKTVSAIKDFVYLYRIGLPGQSMSVEKLQRQCGQHERVLDRLLAFYDQHKTESCRKVLETTLARILTSQYKIYLLFTESHKEQLLAMEERIRGEYPAIYPLVTQKAILFLRRTGYWSYGMVSFLVRRWAH